VNEFKVGDKVIIKPDLAKGLLQPWRGWCEKRRVGAILLIDPNSDRRDGNIKVDFAGKRKVRYPYDYWYWFTEKELEIATL